MTKSEIKAIECNGEWKVWSERDVILVAEDKGTAPTCPICAGPLREVGFDEWMEMECQICGEYWFIKGEDGRWYATPNAEG